MDGRHKAGHDDKRCEGGQHEAAYHEPRHPAHAQQLREVYEKPARNRPHCANFARIDAGAAVIARIVDSGQTVYGVNTGFGCSANTSIGGTISTSCSGNWC